MHDPQAQASGRFLGDPPLWVEDHRPGEEHGPRFVLLGSVLTSSCCPLVRGW